MTHSGADGSEGDHPLNAVGVAAAVGLETGVVSLLQDKLLATETGVLIPNPARGRKKEGYREGMKEGEKGRWKEGDSDGGRWIEREGDVGRQRKVGRER